MRRWKYIIGLLAILGVLGHAGLIVRHNTMIVAHAFALQDLEAAIAEICHGSSGAAARPDGEGTGGTIPRQSMSDCPLCSGFCAAIAILPERPIVAGGYDAASTRIAIVAEIIARRTAKLRPPPTGPPSIV